MRHVIFDTETTGFEPREGHRLVEIGAVEMKHGGLTGRTFHVYVNPERDMPDGAYQVHKLSAEFLSDKPVFADPSVGQAFVEFVDDAVLIAHNASFDMNFIQFELEKAGLPKLDNEVVDTLKIAKRRFPGSPASLDALCNRFGIDLTAREKDGHGALLDSRLLAEVYIELTGGAQAGLAFEGANAAFGGQRIIVPPNPVRAAPRKALLTDAEKKAHETFIAEMENPLWRRVLN
ncbi:DNA polymerase III subunit epsilon [Parvularcula sp. LCG005]|uniref:DNA polymerase III subunit epsilon n=1 Tax=Parvularcula sp. LCG005 TaxID=3078805 RepID=UPI002942C78C|nr:DNA polymerase III subunit epsilon [Parvularcula sp. LCG005]WOI53316.1 DNA polymerase III subunit epsilon [Parvularcula sp. LCG005]